MLSTILSATALLATTALAQTQLDAFYVYTMQGFDMRIPYTQHNVSFNLNAPNNTFEEGGDNYGLCSIGWLEGSAPTCWQECKSQSTNSSASNPTSTYYARLDSFSSVDAYNISVWQSYEGHHNTGLIQIRSGTDGYYCSHGAQTTQCSIGFPFKPVQVPATQNSGGCEPTDFPVCSS